MEKVGGLNRTMIGLKVIYQSLSNNEKDLFESNYDRIES